MMTSITATELPRVMVCMGSLSMSPSIPDSGTSEQRDEGNAAHWLAEQMFAGITVSPGQAAPNGFIVTQDMIEHVGQYVSALDCGELEADTSYTGNGWEIRGRADHVKFLEGGDTGPHTLVVDDFKYGWRIVEPNRNWTLLSHAIGWCIRNNTRPDRIVLRIHQPRPIHHEGPLREWSCSYDQLMGYHNQINHRLSNPTDELVTSLEHCAKCHALATCPAARQAGMNAVDASLIAFDDSLPRDVLVHEMETLRHAVGMIENRRDALEEFITHRIKEGDVFEGYGLERRFGQRKFKTGLTGKALSTALGVDLTKDGLVTPAEAERRGVPKEVVEKLVDRPVLPPKLKAIDADAKARSVFGESG